MKKLFLLITLLSGLFLSGQVRIDEPYKRLFINMGWAASHTVEQYQRGAIYIMFQNIEYKTISDMEMLKIGDDIDEAILTYTEMLNTLSLAKGTYVLTNGIKVSKSGNSLIVRSGRGVTDGYTLIYKMQCKKGIKRLRQLK